MPLDITHTNTWGAGTNPNATMTVTPYIPDPIAPAGVWIEPTNHAGFNLGAAVDANDDPAHQELFTVTLIEGRNGTVVGDYNAALNIPTSWRTMAYLFGPEQGIALPAGDYRTTTWAADRSGNYARVENEFTIQDPDAVFTGGRTICFDRDSNFTGAPAGHTPVTTEAALQSAMAAVGNTCRVLFRAGADISDFSISASGGMQNWRFGVYGAAGPNDRCILRPPRNGDCFTIGQGLSGITDRNFDGLDVRGSWDPTHEVGGFGDGFMDMLLSDAPGMMTVLNNCRFSGLSGINLSTLKAIEFTSIICDTIISDWSNVGLYMNDQADGVNDNSRLGIAGVAIQQNPDACNGPKGAFIGIGNQLGPVRYETVRKVSFQTSYFFSNTSWGVGSQPCLRIGTGNQGGLRGVFARGVCEGGTGMYSNDVSGSGLKDSANFRFGPMIVAATADLKEAWVIDYGGHVAENVYFWMPNVDRYDAPRGFFSSVAEEQGASVAQRNSRLEIRNCTGVYLDDSQDMPFFRELSDFPLAVEENNVFHAPNQPTPDVANVDLTGTIAGIAPRYAGRRASIGRPLTNSGTVANGGTINFSYPNGQDGSTPLTSASFSGTQGRHWIKNTTTGQLLYADQGDFSVSFDGGQIVVTNTSGASWTGGDFRLIPDFPGYVTDTASASPATIPLPVPNGAPELGGATGGIAYSELFPSDPVTDKRPGSGFFNAPAGTADMGAVEA